MDVAIVPPVLSAQSERAVKQLPAPSRPPTVNDITKSLHYAQDLLNAHTRKKVSDEELLEGEQYKNKLVATRESGEPVWFVEALSRTLDEKLAPIQTQLQTIKDDLRDVKNDMRGLKEDMTCVRRIAAMSYNLYSSTGDEAGFAVVPFANGQDPTRAPNNLPHLTCPKDIRELNGEDRDKYYKGYYPLDPWGCLPPIAERIDKIFLAIGGKNY